MLGDVLEQSYGRFGRRSRCDQSPQRPACSRTSAMKTARYVRSVLFLIVTLPLTAAACGDSRGPMAPSQPRLPVVRETANFRFHYAAGDSVDVDWQESYHTWAVSRLGLRLTQKIDYFKYQSRQDMGDHTGNYNTNGFAEPERLEVHTLWPTDNHEVVHIYTALAGRPSDFFNEGIAVALQTDPARFQFESVFNGVEVHRACRQYLQAGTLVVPLDRVVSTTDFRAISDSTLSYREAGSFIRFVLDRYGVAPTLEFFRLSSRTDNLAVIKARFQGAFGASLGDVESAWLAMLRNLGSAT